VQCSAVQCSAVQCSAVRCGALTAALRRTARRFGASRGRRCAGRGFVLSCLCRAAAFAFGFAMIRLRRNTGPRNGTGDVFSFQFSREFARSRARHCSSLFIHTRQIRSIALNVIRFATVCGCAGAICCRNDLRRSFFSFCFLLFLPQYEPRSQRNRFSWEG